MRRLSSLLPALAALLVLGSSGPAPAQQRTRVPIEPPRLDLEGLAPHDSPVSFGPEPGEAVPAGEPAPGESPDSRVRGLFATLAEAYRREDLDALMSVYDPGIPGADRLRRAFEWYLKGANYFALDFQPLALEERENRVEGDVLIGMRLRPTDRPEDVYVRDRVRVVVLRQGGRDRFREYRSVPLRSITTGNPVTATRYDLEVRLRPAEGVLDVRGKVVLKNTRPEPAGKFGLNLLPLAEGFTGTRLDGTPLPLRCEPGRVLFCEATLDTPIPPGERFSFEFSYTLRAIGRSPEVHIAPGDTYLLDRVAWYPFFQPVFDPGEPVFDFDLRVTAPADESVFGGGESSPPEDAGGGARAWRFWTSSPTAEIPLVAGRYESRAVAARGGRLSLRIHRFPGRPEDGAREVEGVLGETIGWLEDRLGPIPAREFTVVPARRPGLYAWGTLLVLGTDYLETPGGVREDPSLFLNWITHQACHAWFVNGIQPRGAGELVLREGLCNYFGIDILEDMFRAGSREALLRNRLEVFRNSAGADLPLVEVTPRTPEWELLVGDKAEVIGAMLESWMGEDAFRRGLQAFFRDFRGRPAGLADLARSMSQADPSAQVFFDDWFFARNLADPAVVSLESVPAGEGLHRTVLVLRNLGGGHIRVTAEFRSGAQWAAEGSARLGPGEETRLEVLTPLPVTLVELDPVGEILQVNRDNDFWPDASAHRRRRFPPRKAPDFRGEQKPKLPPDDVFPSNP